MTKDLRLIESRSNQTKNEKQKENLGELGKKKRKFLKQHVLEWFDLVWKS